MLQLPFPRPSLPFIGSGLQSGVMVPTIVPFDAADFTASGAMIWTVAAGDVATFTYQRIGKRLFVDFLIATTDVGGVPSNTLQIAVPGGFTIKRTFRTPCFVNDNGTQQIGRVEGISGGTLLLVLKATGANYLVSAGATAVSGNISFEIT